MPQEFCQRSGKVKFANKNEAQRSIGSLRDRGAAKVPLRTYDCQHCGCVHLTSDTTAKPHKERRKHL